MSIPELTQKINFRRGQIEHTLKYLSVENPSPVYNDRSKWKRAPTKFEMDYEKIVRLTHQREIEWQEVKDYINHEGCLMQYLQRSLDDPTASNCGICANCRGVNLLPTEIDLETGKEAASFIKKTDLPLNLKKQIPSGALAIYGWRGNLPYHLRGQEGRILSRWKDAGWGTIVARNKHQRHFENILVDAMYNLIVERWSPNPFPEWVTCVPSINNPDLVPDFASRLAKKLGLPFHNIIKKIKNNGAQKNQENRYYQCENLDGVFEIQEQISNKSVLLVDDAVDSGWTLTILAALLLQGGSGAVFPVALTTTNIGG